MFYGIMKKLFILLTIICTSVKVQTQEIRKTIKELPDTGQTKSYTDVFGEDSDYTINPMFFLEKGDGTIIDTVTGLQWQKNDGGEMTIENAEKYCDTLTIGGYQDWRLPSPIEAFSILNHQNSNPAINTQVFTKTAAEYWWTNTYQIGDNSKVWVVNSGGGIGNHPKSETASAGGTKKFHVRAVRYTRLPTAISERFTHNNDGTVTDNLTGLQWYKNITTSPYDWEQALNYAENLEASSYGDWRLPNIKELQSIHNSEKTAPALFTDFFGSIGVEKIWSSTTLANQSTKAWFFDTRFGITSYELKDEKFRILCVRTKQLSTDVKEKEDDDNVSFYPNPCTNRITFTNSEAECMVKIWNANGVLLFSECTGNTIDMSKLPAGTYYIYIPELSSKVFTVAKQ